MADGEDSPRNSNEENNGEGTVSESNLDQEIAAERQQYQPTKLESFFAITKSLIIRALVIYFISSFFRRGPSQPEQGSDGGPAPVRVPAFNVFENGSIMVNEDDDFLL